jgi:hypothetical protein
MDGEGKSRDLTHKNAGCSETRDRSHAILNESARDRVSHGTEISIRLE